MTKEQVVQSVRDLIDRETRRMGDDEYLDCLEEVIGDIEMSVEAKKAEMKSKDD